jgi:hypothetical protein
MNKRQKEIESEIECYKPKAVICKIMRDLGKLGFSFSGHGGGFGGEDFNFIKRSTYVNINHRHSGKIIINISKNINRKDGGKLAFSGSPMKAMKLLNDN